MADISPASTIPLPMMPERYCYAKHHGDGIVYRRHTYEWILPAALGPFIKFNPSHLPVVMTDVVLEAQQVHIWELTAERLDFDRRVFATGKPNEDYYLRMSVERIECGYCGSTALPTVSFI